ncbi:hypothetical protein [Pseudoduganella violacea]|uniref:Uncharacterized protein n=1 Tax=Pseudoduganella violacea TaxID=1715466 RepID=A0A7W5BGA4_9BURK|nr:hypothetical protein [Pseudoduganella violacea]MBB3121725.1 hypothetical protein [Pseudoduganella violacea]
MNAVEGQTNRAAPEEPEGEVCYRDVCPKCPSTDAHYRCWEERDEQYMYLHWRVFCRDCGHMNSGLHTTERDDVKSHPMRKGQVS